MTSKGFAPAKVNLALHVTGVRDDGYHLLESLVVFASVGDRLTASAALDLTLMVTGPFATGVPVDGTNLVLRAAELLRQRRGVSAGAKIHLDKHLPHGGGIGGGSSDAASSIRILADLWDVAPLTAAEALPLGADVPVCLAAPQPMIMAGIGDDLRPAYGVPDGWLVLVNPGVAVPTGPVFALHDRLYPTGNPGLEPLPLPADMEQFEAWLLGQRNDLTKVACEPGIAPAVGNVLKTLRDHTNVAEMSGSGSTCWGWFRQQPEAEAAAGQIAASHPEWWVRAAPIMRPTPS